MSEQTMTMDVLDERVELTLVELCRASRANEQQVRVWVLEGVLEPRGASAEEWRFAAAAVRRARIARSLTQDLEVNAPGVALALDLMDQIEALQASLRRAGLRQAAR
ncbi:MAG: MerR family transcriptional regulator [Burkholderiales bacterium]|nr:MerR family transcriptional regulator [Burkholderiales bacterium]MDE1929153.1 MerR family transcriptional regulator [Burkholderiales bacterium]MDE2159561.1 MerR family transcriptional regulator [Burkholderiales bacterium]MDE2503293.1 MerR family transcriptional regulator [Burkholderiales bacterium]